MGRGERLGTNIYEVSLLSCTLSASFRDSLLNCQILGKKGLDRALTLGFLQSFPPLTWVCLGMPLLLLCLCGLKSCCCGSHVSVTGSGCPPICCCVCHGLFPSSVRGCPLYLAPFGMAIFLFHSSYALFCSGS